MNLKPGIGSIAVVALVAVGGLTAIASQSDDGEHEALADVIAEAREDGSPETIAALANGHVSFEEREVAVRRTAECAEGRGVQVELRETYPGAPRDLGFAAPTIEEAEASRQILEECKSSHLNGLHKVYAAQNRPDDAELAAGRAFFAQCMAEKGVAVSPGPVSEEQMISWAQAEDELTRTANAICVDRHYAELGFWP